MWPGPFVGLSAIATGCGAVACAWVLFVVIALWRRGAGLVALLPLGGLLAIMLSVWVAAVLRLIGLRQGTDTALAAVMVQFGGAIAGFALIVATLLLRRRAAAPPPADRAQLARRSVRCTKRTPAGLLCRGEVSGT